MKATSLPRQQQQQQQRRPQHRVDVYDERNLQAKALERWHKQREVWDGVKTKLLTQTGRGVAARGVADNFAFASARHRERREEMGVLDAAVPLSALSNHYAWESMLRRENDADAVRYVQLGKAYFPYALFAELRDPTSRKHDHAVYTRVVAEDYLMDPLASIDQRTGKHASWLTRHSRASGVTDAPGDAAAKAVLGRRTLEPRVADLDAVDAALRAMGGGGGSAESDDSVDTDDKRGRAGHDHHDNNRGSLEAPTLLGETNAYYKQQLRAYAPFIEKRFAHFTVPRQYLAVEGTAAPIACMDDARESLAQDGDDGDDDVEPVQYFPPPPPRQQCVAIPSAATSRPHSVDTAAPGPCRGVAASSPSAGRTTATPTPSFVGAGGKLQTPPSPQQHQQQRQSTPVSVRLSSVSDALAAVGGPPAEGKESDGMNDSRVLRGEDAAEGALSAPDNGGHPSLELSTQRLFLHTRPGELAHAHLTIRNTSNVTVYYSWVGVDLVQEDIADAIEEGNAATGAAPEEGGEGSSSGTEGAATRKGTEGASGGSLGSSTNTAPLSAFVHAQQTLHRMARHAATSRHYFRLSSPTNGVILPDEEELFPFSIRAPCPGRFKHRYELLTIPPSPTRIFVELTALVRDMGVSARALARPVEAALSARVRQDAQRHVMQALVRSDAPLDASDLLDAIGAVRARREEAVGREEALRTAQREAWHRANAASYDGIPYNRAVYDKMEMLSRRVVTTLDVLTTPSDHGEAPPRDAADVKEQGRAVANPLVPISALQWDGSINTLLAKVSRIRDAPTRGIFYDAAMALLRAARATTTLGKSGTHTSTSTATSTPDVRNGEGEDVGEVEEGAAALREDAGERASLATLLHAAAEAVARQVEARRVAAYAAEADMLQLPLEPSLYACAASASSGAAASADRKKRSTLASAGTRKAGTGGGGAAAAAGAGAGVAPGMAGGAAGGGDGSTAAVLGSFRGHLRDAVLARCQANADEEEGRQREKDEMVAALQRNVSDGHAALVAAYWRELSDAVEAGCDVSMTHVVQSHRLEDLRTIQTHEAMTVDVAVDVLPMKVAANGNSGRKR